MSTHQIHAPSSNDMLFSSLAIQKLKCLNLFRSIIIQNPLYTLDLMVLRRKKYEATIPSQQNKISHTIGEFGITVIYSHEPKIEAFIIRFSSIYDAW